MRMKGSGYKHNVHKCVLQTLKVCVCVCFGQNALKCLSILLCASVCLEHTAWVFIPIHSRSGRRIIQNDRKIICRSQSPRRIHIYLEGWYIIRGSTVSFVGHLSSSSKDRHNPSMAHLSTQTLYKHIPNCWSKSNQEDG
ncbi:hypothetical protein HanPI659440_Chr17g0672171 [Helianthus annuus]|nr:hypothetical protein HanPI659440_Chr17g0672171 [Helianthus annuus]